MLVGQVTELEEERARQAHKISKLKGDVHEQSSEIREKRVVADNAVSALSSELRTTKTALHTIQNREKQVSRCCDSLYVSVYQFYTLVFPEDIKCDKCKMSRAESGGF